MPDIARAKGAASVLFETVDRLPKIDTKEGSGKRNGSGQNGRIKGRISFKAVSFAYPQRPDATVLRGFNLQIKPGQTVALGAS